MTIYQLNDGFWLSETDIKSAFHVLSGTDPIDNPVSFGHWFQYMRSSDKLKAYDSDAMDNKKIAEIAKSRWSIAVMIVRERDGCTIREAKDKVDEMRNPDK